MAKSQAPRPKSILNRHLHARINFLYQAASYLSHGVPTPESHEKDDDLDSHIQPTDPAPAPAQEEKADVAAAPIRAEGSSAGAHISQPSGLGNILVSHLRSVSMKSQVKISCELKRTLCKTCDGVLLPGRTATVFMENKSRGGRKPWADVLIVGCKLCGTEKRFPVGAKRQPPKTKTDPLPEAQTHEKSAKLRSRAG